MAGTHRSTVTLLRMFADEDGESHLALEELGPDAPHNAMGRLDLLDGMASGFNLRMVPPGWKRNWGPTNRRVLAIYVAGHGIVEVSDGEQHELFPGVILLAEDTTGRGHRAEVVGDTPLAVMHVKLSASTPLVGDGDADAQRG